jgi:hypothetical protein
MKNKILKNELELYLGDIMQQLDNTFDWIEKRRLERKKHAIEVLLEISATEYVNYKNAL